MPATTQMWLTAQHTSEAHVPSLIPTLLGELPVLLSLLLQPPTKVGRRISIGHAVTLRTGIDGVGAWVTDLDDYAALTFAGPRAGAAVLG